MNKGFAFKNILIDLAIIAPFVGLLVDAGMAREHLWHYFGVMALFVIVGARKYKQGLDEAMELSLDVFTQMLVDNNVIDGNLVKKK